jgi:GrpB-like predicted nucleotidyltransferase (UPF0157 family)
MAPHLRAARQELSTGATQNRLNLVEILLYLQWSHMDAPIHIEPHSPAWPIAFAAERDVLRVVLAPWLAGPIEHVGSTAVPGLAAKPVIDIMAAVWDLESSRTALPLLAQSGYCHAPYKQDAMHWFCKPGFELRTHHLHLVPYRSALWNDRIAFRDRLRADSSLADEYAQLKRRLAVTHRHDREAYTEAKTPFIEKVLSSSASGR